MATQGLEARIGDVRSVELECFQLFLALELPQIGVGRNRLFHEQAGHFANRSQVFEGRLVQVRMIQDKIMNGVHLLYAGQSVVSALPFGPQGHVDFAVMLPETEGLV